MEITMAETAMPAALSIDLNQTVKNNPAMYALERLHAELDGWAAKSRQRRKMPAVKSKPDGRRT
jgi:hypothetical protein